jgi:hypothetical protein
MSDVAAASSEQDSEEVGAMMGDNGEAGGDGARRGAGSDGEGVAGHGGRGGGGWSMPEGMRVRLEEAFEMMDKDKDGMLDEDERRQAAEILEVLSAEFGVAIKAFGSTGMLSRGNFLEHFRREWEVDSKARSLGGGKFLRIFAESLPGGSRDDPLGGIRGMTDENVGRLFREILAGRLEGVLQHERRSKVHDKEEDDNDNDNDNDDDDDDDDEGGGGTVFGNWDIKGLGNWSTIEEAIGQRREQHLRLVDSTICDIRTVLGRMSSSEGAKQRHRL